LSHKLIDRARRRLSQESGPGSNPWGGRLSVALVYPNTYHHAMSNLGFLSVYQMLNAREDTLCERFYLPDPEDLDEHRRTGYPLFSLESQTRLSEFDLVAFSISFENDYLNLPILFELAGLPLWREERNEQHPLVLAGGVCAFLNPEPLAEICDLFAIGEAEVLLAPLIAALRHDSGARAGLLAKLATVDGIYVPSHYIPEYDQQGLFTGYRVLSPGRERVARQWLSDYDSVILRSELQTRATEFGELSLVEVSRGCSRGCRFCAAGFLFLPPREHALEKLQDACSAGLETRNRIGLVGAAVSDYPRLGELQGSIAEQGGESSLASLRIDCLDAEEVDALKQGGHRSVALAPEAGSQRLRDLINKGLDELQILDAVRLLAAGGILNLKLYFLIGLPTETDTDIDELLELVDKARCIWLEEGRKLGRLGSLLLSVNPFVPKPFTPFQWAGMATQKQLKQRIKRLQGALRRIPNVELSSESLKGSILQALLSRGDRRVGRLLPALAAGQPLKAACRDSGVDLDTEICRERDEHEVFPWEVLDSRVSRSYLWREYTHALAGRSTPRCAAGCHRCGVCG